MAQLQKCCSKRFSPIKTPGIKFKVDLMSKKKLTREQKAFKAKRKAEWMTIFINGKQKQVRRPATIDGFDAETFIENNADDIWLLQEGSYEQLEARAIRAQNMDDELPF